jgi:uncharacterized protein YdeI (BOF family)
MKKIAIIIMMGLVLVGTLSAQNIRANVETKTISGKLALVNGFIAVESEGQSYYAHGFQYLLGFVDGLKEGATVSLEGYVLPFQNDSENLHFMATKLTINGKDYELQVPQNSRGFGMHRNFDHRQNRGDWDNDRDRGFNRGGRHHGGNNRGRW